MMIKKTITISIPNIPENRRGIDAIQTWSDSIPTVYFLDICSISRIKTQLAKDNDEIIPGDQHLSSLKSIDLTQNAISYFPALMEKASNQKNKVSAEELIEEATNDFVAIGSFFERAKIFESKDFVFSYIKELNGAHPEILGERYHSFLTFVNASGIYNPLAASKRIGAAKSICNEADKLEICKAHPIVLASLACIYGCLSAKKVMKFKKDPSDFNPSNALGDIQTIQRIGLLSQEIEERGRNGSGAYLRTCFITHDEHLEKFYNFFTVNDVKTELNDNGSKNEFNVSVKSRHIFPDLYGDNGGLKNSDCEQELLKIYEIIGAKAPA